MPPRSRVKSGGSKVANGNAKASPSIVKKDGVKKSGVTSSIKVEEEVLGLIDEPEQFFEANQSARSSLAKQAKSLFDLGAAESKTATPLLIEGFDNEQIWQSLKARQQGELADVETTLDDLLKGGDDDLDEQEDGAAAAPVKGKRGAAATKSSSRDMYDDAEAEMQQFRALSARAAAAAAIGSDDEADEPRARKTPKGKIVDSKPAKKATTLAAAAKPTKAAKAAAAAAAVNSALPADDNPFFKLTDLHRLAPPEDDDDVDFDEDAPPKKPRKIVGNSFGLGGDGDDENASGDDDPDDLIDPYAEEWDLNAIDQAGGDDDNEDITDVKYSDFFDPLDDGYGGYAAQPNASKLTISEADKRRLFDAADKKDAAAKLKKKAAAALAADNDGEGDENEEIEGDLATMQALEEEEEQQADERARRRMEAGDADMDDMDANDVGSGGDIDEDNEDDDGDDDDEMRKLLKGVSDEKTPDDDLGPDPNAPGLSTYERQQRTKQREIRLLEKGIVAPKSWELSGEVSTRDRPTDSLLAHEADFERASKVQEPITAEVNEAIEDMIRKRIIGELWDDVERKVEEVSRDFKPKDELSQDKSERGLGEIAADEMAAMARRGMGDGSTAADDKLKAEHAEVSKALRDIFHHLDGLSNSHFTPRHIKDTEITSKHTAALDMEEQTPLATSAAQMSAPQEKFVKATKDGVHVDKTEMSQDERKAARKRNKTAKKKHNSQVTESKKAHEKIKDAKRVARGDEVADDLLKGSKGKKKADAIKATQQINMSRGNVQIGKGGDQTNYTSVQAFTKIAAAEKAHQARGKKSASARAAGIATDGDAAAGAAAGKKKDRRAAAVVTG